MTPDLLLIVALVFLAAGTVKGISGMGLPTVSMALLGLLMAPAQAAALNEKSAGFLRQVRSR